MKIHLMTKMMAVAFAMIMLAVPVLAASEEAAVGEVNFHALSGIGEDTQASPAPLTDEQLASVEGGTHFLDAAASLVFASGWAAAFGTTNNPISAAFRLVATIQQSGPAHTCAGPSLC